MEGHLVHFVLDPVYSGAVMRVVGFTQVVVSQFPILM